MIANTDKGKLNLIVLHKTKSLRIPSPHVLEENSKQLTSENVNRFAIYLGLVLGEKNKL